MRNGDEGGVWDIIRHQKWRKNDVDMKSGYCSPLQQNSMEFLLDLVNYLYTILTLTLASIPCILKEKKRKRIIEK